MSLKTIFLGTPALAVPYLELLIEKTEVAGVITTPDEPSGRGYALTPSAVKEAALRHHLPVFQPAKLKDETFLSQIRALAPELSVVVAYGKILPPAFLQIPARGHLNVHFSLLPAYRGAAPMQRALMAGETQTGVSLFWLDEGMDTGPLFLQKALPIAEEDDAETLRAKLVPLGVDLLRDALLCVDRGEIQRLPQKGASSSAPPIRKEECLIDWNRPALLLANLIRGTFPMAFTSYHLDQKPVRLKVLKAVPLTHFSDEKSTVCGGVAGLERGEGFVVKCSSGYLKILQVQPEGKRPMSAWAFWQGSRLKQGGQIG